MATVESDSYGNILTVRLIRSFEHRNIQHVVFKNVDFSQTTANFMQAVTADLKNRSGVPPPFKRFAYDTFKIQHKAHGAKTSDPVINTENDEMLMLKNDVTLSESGVENETELSLFKMADYLMYKENPHTSWHGK